MSDERRLGVGLVAYAIALGCIVAVFTCDAGAQAVPSLSTLLARTSVREAGWRAYEHDDASAIDAVVQFRAEHIYRTDYTAALMRYTHRAPVDLGHRRPWIAQPVPSGREPALLPRRFRWEHLRPHWLRTYQQAVDIVRRDVQHRCQHLGERLTPHDWGSEQDAVRYRRIVPDAVQLDCGDTLNLFFHVPRYGRRFGP